MQRFLFALFEPHFLQRVADCCGARRHETSAMVTKQENGEHVLRGKAVAQYFIAQRCFPEELDQLRCSSAHHRDGEIKKASESCVVACWFCTGVRDRCVERRD